MCMGSSEQGSRRHLHVEIPRRQIKMQSILFIEILYTMTSKDIDAILALKLVGMLLEANLTLEKYTFFKKQPVPCFFILHLLFRTPVRNKLIPCVIMDIAYASHSFDIWNERI